MSQPIYFLGRWQDCPSSSVYWMRISKMFHKRKLLLCDHLHQYHSISITEKAREAYFFLSLPLMAFAYKFTATTAQNTIMISLIVISAHRRSVASALRTKPDSLVFLFKFIKIYCSHTRKELRCQVCQHNWNHLMEKHCTSHRGMPEITHFYPFPLWNIFPGN